MSQTNKAFRIFFLFSIGFHIILLVLLGLIIHTPKTEYLIEVDLKALTPGKSIREIPQPPKYINDVYHPSNLKSQVPSMQEVTQIQKNITTAKARIKDYSIIHAESGSMPDSSKYEITPVRNIIENIKDLSIPQLPMFLGPAISDIDQIDIYKSQILSHIKKYRKYPLAARKLGIKGTINVDFLLYRDGTLGEIKVTKKSKYQILNNAAIESIRAGEPYPPFPFGIKEKSIIICVPITFNLVEETAFN